MKKLVNFIRGLVRPIPVVGGLVDAKRRSIRAASAELILSTIFSTAPVWFFPMIAALFIGGSSSFGSNVGSSLAQGELLVFSSAIVGPLIFAITKNYAAWDFDSPSPQASRIGKLTFEFPYGVWFFSISIVICVVAALLFGLFRFSTMGLISINLNNANILQAGIILYCISITCLFSVSVYKNELESFSSSMPSDTDSFVRAWRDRNE